MNVSRTFLASRDQLFSRSPVVRKAPELRPISQRPERNYLFFIVVTARKNRS